MYSWKLVTFIVAINVNCRSLHKTYFKCQLEKDSSLKEIHNNNNFLLKNTCLFEVSLNTLIIIYYYELVLKSWSFSSILYFYFNKEFTSSLKIPNLMYKKASKIVSPPLWPFFQKSLNRNYYYDLKWLQKKKLFSMFSNLQECEKVIKRCMTASNKRISQQ